MTIADQAQSGSPSDLAFSPADLQGAATASAVEVIRLVGDRLGRAAAIAASFGVEDLVVIDLCRIHAPDVELFTLDTGRLPSETYEVMERVRRRYGIEILAFAPERAAVEALESTRGFFSFRDSVAARQACCALRKLEPLRRALAGRAAWLTGLRRDQAESRASVEPLAWDATHGLWKVNPLAAWTSAQTWEYARAHDLPTNPLHDQGYASIGCAPCTRAIRPGEHERAGRWWWEASGDFGNVADHRECGLHVARAPQPGGSR